ncbi:hypothetical protein CP02DC14_1038B, partial [Chlamydia psittaci 02DC14]
IIAPIFTTSSAVLFLLIREL